MKRVYKIDLSISGATPNALASQYTVIMKIQEIEAERIKNSL